MAAFDRVLAALNQPSPTPAGSEAPAPAAPDGKPSKKKRRQADVAPDASAPCEQPAQAAVQRRKRRKVQRDGAAAPDVEPEAVRDCAGVQKLPARAPAAAPPDAGVPKAAAQRAGGSHLARFTRRRSCKDARSYSGADLAAILGAAPGSSSSGMVDSGGDGTGTSAPDSAAAPLAAATPGVHIFASHWLALLERRVFWCILMAASPPQSGTRERSCVRLAPGSRLCAGMGARRLGVRCRGGGHASGSGGRRGERLVARLLCASGPPGQPGPGRRGCCRSPRLLQATGGPPSGSAVAVHSVCEQCQTLGCCLALVVCGLCATCRLSWERLLAGSELV